MLITRFEHGVVVAALDDSAPMAARRMRDAHVGCVVVVRDGLPVGILTDRDLAVRVVAEGRDAEATRISEIVTYEATTIPRDSGVETAVRLMSEHGVRRLPIVAEDGRVTGIISADDITVMLTQMLADLGVGIRDNVDASESR